MKELNDILSIGKIRLNPNDAPITQIYNDVDFTVVNVFNENDVLRGDAISVDPTNNHLVINTAETYEIGFIASASFGGGEELSLRMIVDGVPDGPTWHAQGRGAGKPILINMTTIVNLNAGVVLQMGARNADAGDVSVEYESAAFYARKV